MSGEAWRVVVSHPGRNPLVFEHRNEAAARVDADWRRSVMSKSVTVTVQRRHAFTLPEWENA